MKRSLFLPSLAFLSPVAIAAAAPVIFSPPATVSGVADVSTAGSLLGAYNWSSNQTVNGVAFVRSTLNSGVIGTNLTLAGWGSTNATAFTSTTAPFTSLDAAYKANIVGAVYNGTQGTTGTVTLNGLTSGRHYMVQAWVGDPRSGTTTARTNNFNGANSYVVDFNVGNSGGGQGQHIKGVVVADSASANFTVSSPSTGLPQINAIQIRDVTGAGWWSGADGSAWDAAVTANFSVDTAGTPGTFDAAKAAVGNVFFADTSTPGGAAVANTTPTIAAGGVSGANVSFINTIAYSVNSADATGISGDSTVSLLGGGDVTFLGSNTYTGDTIINSGFLFLNGSSSIADTGRVQLADSAGALLQLGAPETIGVLSGGGAAGGNVVLQSHTLTLAGSAASTYGGAISGTGGITKAGTGALTLSGTSPYSGPTSVTAGRLILSGSVANSDVSITPPGELEGEGTVKTLTLSGNALYVNPATPGALTAASGLTTSGPVTVNLTQPAVAGAMPVINYSGTFTGTTADFALANSSGYRGVNFADTGSAITLDVGAGTRTWNGSGTTWENAGTGTSWVEGDQKFYAGDSVIFNDPTGPQTVTLTGSLAPSFMSVTNTAGNDYTWSGTGTLTAGVLNKSGTGSLTLGIASTSAGGINLSGGGTLTGNLSPTTTSLGSGPISVGAGCTLAINNTNTINSPTAPNVINAFSGSGLIKLIFATGTTARNTQMSNLNGFAGTIQLMRASAAATGDKWNASTFTAPTASLIIEAGTQLFLNSAQTVTLGGVSAIGTGNSENRGAMRFIGTLTAPVTLGGDTTLGSEGGRLNGSISSAAGSPLTLTVGTTASTGNLTVNGPIGGGTSDIALTKVAAGNLVLTGANTYAGTTTISAGTVSIGDAAVVTTAGQPHPLVPGTGLTGSPGSGPIVNNGTLNLRRSDTGLVINNDISGTGALTVNGVAGSLVTLSGNNSFSGAVTITYGGIRITNSSGLGAGTKTVTMNTGSNGQCALRLDGSAGNITLPSTISFTSSVVAGDGGIINEAGDNTIAGNFSLSAGGGGTRFRVDGGTLTLSGTFTPSTTLRTLNLAGAGSGTFSGSLTDANTPGLIKDGTGTWTITGTNAYTGATAVNAGTLVLNGSLAATAATIAPGATLAGTGTSAGTILVNGSVAPGNSAGTLTTGSATINGTLAAEVDGAAADKLMVNGDITLGAASALTVSLLPGGFTQSSYVIAECTGTLSGTFASVPTGYAVTYTANSAILSQAAPAGYAAWAASKGLDGTPGREAGFTDDPDKDGIGNGAEFVLDGDPLASSSAALPAGSIAGSNFVITWTRRDDSEYLNPIIEFDDDMAGTWTTAADPANATITVQENGAAPDTVTVTIPIAGSNRLFARMRVNAP